MKHHFAICGAQLSGKTALCHHVVAALKKKGLNAGYTQEAVRQSFLMFRNERSEKMHLESLLIQITQELLASEHYDLVICDRSALDYLAYANLRFPSSQDSVYLDSVAVLAKEYSKVYTKLFVMGDLAGADPGDPLRKGENVQPNDVSREVARLSETHGCAWSWVKERFVDGKAHPIVEEVISYL